MPLKVSDLGKVAVLDTDLIRPYERNARVIPQRAVDLVAKSLERFGWQQPLVIDPDNVLIAGHVRWRAAKQLKLDSVPVIIADSLSPAEIEAYRIADNRTHDFTSWDFPELVMQLDGLADDFGDVLALDDWRAIIDRFGEEYGLDVPPGVQADIELKGFEITVVFEDKRKAIAAQETILDLDGVIDIRTKTA